VDADPDPDLDPNFYFDADPDPVQIGIKPMQIHMRILPQFLHMLKNREKKFIFIHSNASLHCFSFLISGKAKVTCF
jgi:hypothetical protein